MLDFCGREFEAAWLEFHRTERCVRTASLEQARRPIFKDGIDQWRHFEPWLGGLEQALGDPAKNAYARRVASIPNHAAALAAAQQPPSKNAAFHAP